MIYKIKELEDAIKNGNNADIPKQSGIYRVLNLNEIPIVFLPNSTNTNYSCYSAMKLQDKYSKTKSSGVLYIGKGFNLYKRIKQYIKYGLNLAHNHKGGRSIFQIQNYNQLYIEIIPCNNCECTEKNMLLGFKDIFGELPVANMRI